MRRLSLLAVSLMCAAMMCGTLGCEAEVDTATTADGVILGASIDEIEQKLGPAVSVLPNMGSELRTYKAPSGSRYLLTVENGKVIEIHK